MVITDSSLDKYMGTWIWKENNKSLKMTLDKKVVHYGNGNHIFDVTIMAGTYQYFVDGKAIVPTSDNILNASSGG